MATAAKRGKRGKAAAAAQRSKTWQTWEGSGAPALRSCDRPPLSSPRGGNLREKRSLSRLDSLTELDAISTFEDVKRDNQPNVLPSKGLPPSPSATLLTETALRKSQYLLKQLSDLNLESDCGRRSQEAKDLESQSGLPEDKDSDCHSALSSHQASSYMGLEAKRITGIETVQVPVVLLKMLSENWDEMRLTHNSHVSETALKSKAILSSLSALGTASCDQIYKDLPRKLSSNSSVASGTSTVTPPLASESESDSGIESPYFDSVEPPRAARSYSVQPASEIATPLASTPVSTTSSVATPRPGPPRKGTMMHQVGSLSSLQYPSICRRHSVAALPGNQRISVTASVPLGSSVSVTVTTSQAIQRTQSLRLLPS